MGEKRNITITINKAKEWYNSKNKELKEIALQAFSEKELYFSFENIKTVKDACDSLGLDYSDIQSKSELISTISRASAAMFLVNIVRKALNLGQNLNLTENPENSLIYYPYNPFCSLNDTHFSTYIKTKNLDIIGTIEYKNIHYKILGGDTRYCSTTGVGCFDSLNSVGISDASIGFLGCANKEITQHFSKYFGVLITQAKFGDLEGIEIKKINCFS